MEPAPQRDDTVPCRVRIQVEVLERIYGITARWPGWVMSDAGAEALAEWASQQEAAADRLNYRGQIITKGEGEAYPNPPSGIKTGKPPNGGREQGPVRNTTLHLLEDLDRRIRNIVSWRGDLYLSWAVEDALVAWADRHS